MQIGVVGSGNIGGNLARLWAAAGHDVAVGFSRNPAALDRRAAAVGAKAATAAEVAAHGDVVVISVPGAMWCKSFNTRTAGFLASAAGRTGPDRVVMFYACDDDTAAPVIAGLITDAGFDPVRTGTLDRTEVGHQEPKGDLYGEEFHHDDAVAAVEKLRGTLPSGTGRP